MARFRIATWNINSVRLRLPLLKNLVAQARPHIIALQETKCPTELMPVEGLKALGYKYLRYTGMKGYNGVAFLSKLPLSEGVVHPRVGLLDCRHLETAVELPDRRIVLHNLYIPAGGDIPDPALNVKYRHKLDFVDEMTAWFKKRHKANEQVIALGDFNIAPHENDVWSHKQLLTVVSHTPAEVERLLAMQESLKWVDLGRAAVPLNEKLYTWWSYRNHDWRKSNRGRRLDHIWATPALAPDMKKMTVLSDARDWPQPSDHVPVVAEFKF